MISNPQAHIKTRKGEDFAVTQWTIPENRVNSHLCHEKYWCQLVTNSHWRLAGVMWRSSAQLVLQIPAKYPLLLLRGLLWSSLSLVPMRGRVQKLKQLALKRRPVVNWWVIVPKSASMIHLELRPSYFPRCSLGWHMGRLKRKHVGFVLSRNTRRNKRN